MFTAVTALGSSSWPHSVPRLLSEERGTGRPRESQRVRELGMSHVFSASQREGVTLGSWKARLVFPLLEWVRLAEAALWRQS